MMVRKQHNVVDIQSRRGETHEQLLQRLFNEYAPSLRKFLLARSKEPADMEDMVQDVFAKLAASKDLKSICAASKGSTRSFVFTTANNLFLDRERGKAVRRRYQDEQLYIEAERVDELSPERVAEDAQVLDAVRAAVLGLKPTYRWVFIQSRFKFKTYRQIAEEMGVSVKQIDKYMVKALAEVRRAMERAREVSDK